MFRLSLKIIKYFVIFFLVCCVIGAGFALYLFHKHSQDLPQLDGLKDYNPPVVSEVFANDGTKIGEFWTEKRFLLAPKEIPKVIIDAIVASEDDRFFEHEGIDYAGIMRAMIKNFKAGHIVQGGSTITQQVAKALLLTRDRTWERKIKEAILATRIEKKFNKNEILYLYLNQIYFGNRAYGIEAAARNYFHKSAKELNIAEASMIAGLAKAPSLFSPLRNPQRAKKRQEYVIDRLYQVGYISESQAKRAKEYELTFYRAQTDKEFNLRYTPWFTEYVRRFVQKKYGEQVPYTHGLKIHTTIDLQNQKAADTAIDHGLSELDHRQGYKGAIHHINDSEIESYTQNYHLKLIKKALKKTELFKPIPKDDILLTQPTPLKLKDYYEAVVTKLDSGSQNVHVRVGNVDGLIRVHDYKWARMRNTSLTGYNDVYYVRDPKKKFRVGDIVIVRMKAPSKKDYSSRGYQKSRQYFSLEQIPEVEGALFSYEPQTGFVRAMVGGRDFKQSEFNRSIQSLRQTGSVYKPLLYAAALDKGYNPATIIEDSPIYYEYSPGRFWSPQNYGGEYKGPTSFRSALVNSRNVVSVKILMNIGVDFATAYTRKLGITSDIKRYYSMALGANDMKLFEICRAFGIFPNGGILPELVFIKRMTDRYGRVLEEYIPKPVIPFKEQVAKNLEKADDDNPIVDLDRGLYNRAKKWINQDKLELTEVEKQILYGQHIPVGYTLSPRTAYIMVQLMSDIVNFGTGYKVRELKRPAAGKTGTTNDESDAWFVGFTPNLLAGVWVGFDKVKKLGGKETGGRTAAPIFTDYMKKALEGKPIAKFDIPEDINELAVDAPLDVSTQDAEAGGILPPGSGVDFFIYDF